jgi:DNA-binding protein YbaB
MISETVELRSLTDRNEADVRLREFMKRLGYFEDETNSPINRATAAAWEIMSNSIERSKGATVYAEFHGNSRIVKIYIYDHLPFAGDVAQLETEVAAAIKKGRNVYEAIAEKQRKENRENAHGGCGIYIAQTYSDGIMSLPISYNETSGTKTIIHIRKDRRKPV